MKKKQMFTYTIIVHTNCCPNQNLKFVHIINIEIEFVIEVQIGNLLYNKFW